MRTLLIVLIPGQGMFDEFERLSPFASEGCQLGQLEEGGISPGRVPSGFVKCTIRLA